MWPTSNPIPSQPSLELTAQAAVRAAHMLLKGFRQRATNLKADSAAGPTGRNIYANFCEDIANTVDQLNICKSVSGLNAAAQIVYGNPAFDAVAEIDGRISDMNALKNWIVLTAPFPTNAGGFALEWQFDVNGRRSYGTFTVAQTANFRNQIDTFLAGT